MIETVFYMLLSHQNDFVNDLFSFLNAKRHSSLQTKAENSVNRPIASSAVNWAAAGSP